jgi:hypothetical protein
MLFARLLHSAKPNQSLPARFFLGHSTSHVFLDCQVNV